jgi:hypothetical protein
MELEEELHQTAQVSEENNILFSLSIGRIGYGLEVNIGEFIALTNITNINQLYDSGTSSVVRRHTNSWRNWISPETRLIGQVLNTFSNNVKVSIICLKDIEGNEAAVVLTVKVPINVVRKFTNISEEQRQVLEVERLKGLEAVDKYSEEVAQKFFEENKTLLEERIATVKELAEEMHPGDWDFARLVADEFKNSDAAKYRLTIHFPEIEITNSEGEEHKITDLYVSMFFDESMAHCSDWHGARGSLSFAEYCAEYRHSHLSGLTSGYSHFCLGEGTTVDIVNGLLADRWNPDLLMRALLLMHTYVRWESLEGGPYCEMSSIASNSNESISFPSEVDKRTVVTELLKDCTDFPAKIEESNGLKAFKVDPTDPHFESIVTKYTPGRYKVLKTASGEYLNAASNLEEQLDRSEEADTFYSNEPVRRKIRYKEQTINMTVLPDVEEDTEHLLVANPEITRYVAEKLEKELNKYELNKRQHEFSKMQQSS